MSRHDGALVLFGASGDLAHKKLFPALHAIGQRGRLPALVVGVGRIETGRRGAAGGHVG